MLREGEVVSIIGGAKTYKTWFSLAMAYAVANGDSFIGKDAWIQIGSARVGLKGRPGVDYISTGSAVQNRTYGQCLINT
ncbi:AAA family ATPase [Akkermansiaceae bacterium]|nr:AAA family ATPase [Akkermansiaceae bacterium]